jgi:tyrosinase
MDARRFDRLTQALATRQSSRRAALGGMVGAGLATILGQNLVTAQDATPAMGEMMATPALTSPTGKVTVRKNGSAMTADEKKAFTDAVLQLKKTESPWTPPLSIYDTFVLWHRDAFDCALMAAHMGPAFFPWHRVFVRLFELELQKVHPDAFVPYWDWTVDQGKDTYLWQDDQMGGDGDPEHGYTLSTGPFRRGEWEIKIFDFDDRVRNPSIIRDLAGSHLTPKLPTPQEYEDALNIATYDSPPWNALAPVDKSFRNFFEGWRDCTDDYCDPDVGMQTTCHGPHPLHNGVHLWVAGEVVLAHEVPAAVMEAATPVASPAAAPVATPGAEAPTPASSASILGTMAANSSPSDPVFWMHHSMVDRTWSTWLQRHGKTYVPVSGAHFGQNLNDYMWPYQSIGLNISPAMVMDSLKLGYKYDTDE